MLLRHHVIAVVGFEKFLYVHQIHFLKKQKLKLNMMSRKKLTHL